MTTSTSRGSNSSSNGLLPVTIASDRPSDHATNDDDDDAVDPNDPFDITHTKNAPPEALKRWRQASFVLNASRRFRYTLDLKKDEERELKKNMIRSHAQVIRAALLFRLAGECELVVSPTPVGDEYAVGLEQLVSMTKNQNVSALQQFEGASLAKLLQSNPEKGISGDDADLLKRKNAFGTNTYPRKKGRSFWRFLWEAWQDLTLIILIIAAVVSLILGIKTEGLEQGWYDGGSIFFAVILVIVVTAISDYRQSLQFQNLNSEKQNIKLEIIRGGRTIQISIFDIVVGDVVPLKIGDQVPADGVLITGHSLAIDESSMTGESKIIHKDQKAPFLMSGCKVADGVGAMLVTGVGINTEWGLLMASISEDTGEETPLQVRLNGVATFIGIVGLTVAVSVLAVLLGRYFSGHTKDLNGKVQFVAGVTGISEVVDGVIKIFTIAVTIVVVAVPEGLPLAVTLTLAYSMRKMMADKALASNFLLSACETMGSATTICSDKTGTLTLNQMTVVEAYVGRKKLNPPDDLTKLHPEVLSLINEGIAQNTTGNVFVPKVGGGEVEVSGSPTEKAILSWAVKLEMNFELVRSNSTILHVFPFNSEKKRGGVALKLTDSTVHIHWKGAAEIVLGTCTQYVDSDGHLKSIEEEKVFFKNAIEDMAAQSLRCVAIAYRSYDLDKIPSNEDELDRWSLPEHELVLLAIVGIKDPCRPGVKGAVRVCTEAGVKVRMVTGDNLQTAKAIALECGILMSSEDAVEPNIIEGKTFRELSENEREQIAKRITVMGRSSPTDKLLLVQALRKGGEVVAVTGDGTNDAPALHEVYIGLSMGIQGTEVAKESSDIIILDDNFASVVKGHIASSCYYRFDGNFVLVLPLDTSFSTASSSATPGFGYNPHPFHSQPATHPTRFSNGIMAMAMTSFSPGSNLWYPDSGASNHVTNMSQNIQQFTPFEGPNQITIGNGQGLPINSSGVTTFSSPLKPHISLTLNNLLYVPNITKNLIGVSQFCKDNSVFFEFHSSFCLVKSQDTKETLLMGVVGLDGLYQFPSLLQPRQQTTLTPSAHTASCNFVSYATWHSRLGHPHNDVLKSVFRLCNFPIINKTVADFCTPCCLGKSHKLPSTLSKVVVRWGRSVYANIQKFIQFQLTVNVAALVINVVAAISSGDVPLNAVQLLWVNLIMDTLGALALATEAPTDSLMHRAPVGRREPLITNVMWRNLTVQALYQVAVLLVLNFGGESILRNNQDSKAHTIQMKNTLIFNAFVFCQVFNEFNARKPDEMNVFRGVTKNRLFMGIVGMTFVLQIIIIEFLGKFTTTVKLDWKLWLASLCIGLFSWPLAIVGKFIPVPKTPLSRTFMRSFRRLRKSRAGAGE
uniref:Calcium-transporting ATPase n=1 Tax=Cajanus cajan TaxID=3821 RepID=A0A151S6J8_CAJCA|nr:Calcium-transporting ATPase 9, plasma membrane-type [Cajanus cajan]